MRTANQLARIDAAPVQKNSLPATHCRNSNAVIEKATKWNDWCMPCKLEAGSGRMGCREITVNPMTHTEVIILSELSHDDPNVTGKLWFGGTVLESDCSVCIGEFAIDSSGFEPCQIPVRPQRALPDNPPLFGILAQRVARQVVAYIRLTVKCVGSDVASVRGGIHSLASPDSACGYHRFNGVASTISSGWLGQFPDAAERT